MGQEREVATVDLSQRVWLKRLTVHVYQFKYLPSCQKTRLISTHSKKHGDTLQVMSMEKILNEIAATPRLTE